MAEKGGTAAALSGRPHVRIAMQHTATRTLGHWCCLESAYWWRHAHTRSPPLVCVVASCSEPCLRWRAEKAANVITLSPFLLVIIPFIPLSPFNICVISFFLVSASYSAFPCLVLCCFSSSSCVCSLVFLSLFFLCFSFNASSFTFVVPLLSVSRFCFPHFLSSALCSSLPFSFSSLPCTVSLQLLSISFFGFSFFFFFWSFITSCFSSSACTVSS